MDLCVGRLNIPSRSLEARPTYKKKLWKRATQSNFNRGLQVKFEHTVYTKKPENDILHIFFTINGYFLLIDTYLCTYFKGNSSIPSQVIEKTNIPTDRFCFAQFRFLHILGNLKPFELKKNVLTDTILPITLWYGSNYVTIQ